MMRVHQNAAGILVY